MPQAIETAAKLAESGKLARRQRRQANRQANATSVAEALGVVCALLASTLLTALVIPPDAVFDSSAWVGFGGVGAACYAPDLVSCESWQSVYGVSASVSFVLVMVALLMTVSRCVHPPMSSLTNGLVVSLVVSSVLPCG